MSSFVRCANKDELRAGECKVVMVKDKSLALFNVDGNYYVTQNDCIHQGGPLGDGLLQGENVRCPWHNWHFNVITGKNSLNANVKLKTFEVKIEGDGVLVKV